MIVTCRYTEDSHIKTNTIHTLFKVLKYGLMPLKLYQDILTPYDIKMCQKSQHSRKTWYSLNLHIFTSSIFQVSSHVDTWWYDYSYIWSFATFGTCNWRSYVIVHLCTFRIPSLLILFDFKLCMLIPLQHELTQSADEGVRQLVE